MTKQILIIGGGISGLSLLHYLKKKYAKRSDVEIRLIEKNTYLGGTIRTLHEGSFAFETGPNGFLASKPQTLELVKEIGLESSLLEASLDAKRRFLSLQNTLHEIKPSPLGFLGFKPFSLGDKMRVPMEAFVKKGTDPNETVYEFGTRRLGKNFAELFLDAMVTGIYGGDVRELNLKATFPRIYEIEQTYGSLIRGAFAIRRERKHEPEGRRINVEPKGTLTSFKNGMGELIETLAEKYRESISTGEKIDSFTRANNRYIVQSERAEYSCDEVYLCVPAYAAAEILFYLNKNLTQELRNIPYAPIAVVGLGYKRSAFSLAPKGFGYLIPSREKKEILGCLFSSNIFQGRADQKHMLFQVLIGGSRNPEILRQSQDALVTLAKKEIAGVLGSLEDPVKVFFCSWAKAIPQYTNTYVQALAAIEQELAKVRGVYLVSNYIGGISLNDCIANAVKAAEKSSI